MKYTKYLLFQFFAFLTSSVGAQTITTIAGGLGDGFPATTHSRIRTNPEGIAIDNSGNIYFSADQRIRKVNQATGLISTVVGNGNFVPVPGAVEVDATGNTLYFAADNSIYKRDASGLQLMIGPTGGYAGDGGMATAGKISATTGLATDASGNLYIADKGNFRIRKINPSGTITTIGGGVNGYSGDGGSAIGAGLSWPSGITLDAAGNIYFTEEGNHRLRKINSSGIISTIAGNGIPTFAGDGGPATSASFYSPTDVKVDAAGNIYLADPTNHRIRKINTAGIMMTIAGNGGAGYGGDGGPSTAANLNNPKKIALDPAGNLYIADNSNRRVRKINASGTISTAIGVLPVQGFGGDGGSALTGVYNGLLAITSDGAGNIYVADAGNYRVRKISVSGIVTTYAGNGLAGYYGDGGQATAASIIQATGLAMDRMGNLYIADNGTHHVRKVSPSGIITTIAGGGGSLGDGGPATAAAISANAIAVDSPGNVYIVDVSNQRIRKIDVSTGIITTVAGNGANAYAGDGGPATSASLSNPFGITVDRTGNIYILDNNVCVRKIAPDGIITRVSGGVTGSFGEGVPAIIAPVNPATITTDKWGNVYLGCHTVIQQIDKYGYIHLVAGDGRQGYIGDQLPGKSAELWETKGLATDTLGNVYVTEDTHNSVRKLCCFNGNADRPPLFTHTSPSPLALCTTFGTTSIDTLLTVNDGDAGDTLKWTILTNPSHGTLGGFPTTSVSPGSAVTPAGLTYTPTSGYSGTDNFTIQVSDGIDISFITVQVTITAPPATMISGLSSVCVTDSIVLTGTPAGGTWSATNSNASVNSIGKVFGITAGSDSILYTAANGCGTVVATRVVTVNPLAAAGSISGPGVVCVGSSISLTNATTGGLWSCTSPYASVNNTSGIVVGYAPGTAIITYTKTNSCGTAMTTTNVTISGGTWPGTISGGTTICTGGATTLSTSVAGGTWSSGNTAIASIGTSGIVTGNAVGAAIISYNVAGACGNATAITIVNVSSATPINPITGPSSVCTGNSATLTNTSPGGTWSSSSPSIATISSTGVVTAISQGITAISYVANLGCGTSVATFNMIVNAAPNAGMITNPTTLCAGATAIASSYATGGTWSMNNGNASIGPTGIMTGVSAGSNTITYTVTNSCGTVFTTSTINIYPAPNAGTISGAPMICAGTNTTLTNVVSGGTWSSSNIAVATVGSGNGIVSGIAAGTTNITYTATTGCGTAISTKSITIDAPMAGMISGTGSVCIGGSSTLTSSTTGGTWSSSAPSVATVNSSGVVAALTGGATIISYTTNSSCGSAVATMIFAVGSLPVVLPITGSSNLCVGSTATLSNATVGGVWSSSNATVATIGSGGALTAIAAGSATISYMVTAGCGTSGATYTVIIDSLPPAPSISGADSLCTFGSAIFTASTMGGMWNSSNSSVLAVTSSTGGASGVATGAAMISYTVNNVCGAATTTKNVVVTATDAGTITGLTSLCVGSSTTLGSTTPGGTWASNNAAVATIDPSGVVSTFSAGVSVISYTTTGLCGAATATAALSVGILPVVTPIAGLEKICKGTITGLSNLTTGGTWSSSDLSIATVSATGIVSGNTPGSVTISYSVTAGCGTATMLWNMQIETDPLPAVISAGNGEHCRGISTMLYATIANGIWSSSNTTVAYINPLNGMMTGITPGTANISYTVGNTCGEAVSVVAETILTLPTGFISGSTHLCEGEQTTLYGSAGHGLWLIDNRDVAMTTGVTASSFFIKALTAGNTTVTYTVFNKCGFSDDIVEINVHPTPHIEPIMGASTVVTNRTITLANGVSGGIWSSGDNSVATVDNAGEVTGLKEGVATISYSIANNAGCDTFVTKSVTVTKQERGLSAMFWLYPNPAQNLLTLKWENQYARYADVAITDMLGRFIYSTVIDMPHSAGKTELDVTNIVPGVYNINIKYAGDFFNSKLVIVK